LYILEGAATILFAFSTFWLLPDKADRAYFLNAHDKENMATRLEQSRIYAGNDQFEWRQVRLAFKDFKLYLRYHLISNSLMAAPFVNLVRTSACMDSALSFQSLLRQWDMIRSKHNT
jgi:hypothetical protein